MTSGSPRAVPRRLEDDVTARPFVGGHQHLPRWRSRGLPPLRTAHYVAWPASGPQGVHSRRYVRCCTRARPAPMRRSGRVETVLRLVSLCARSSRIWSSLRAIRPLVEDPAGGEGIPVVLTQHPHTVSQHLFFEVIGSSVRPADQYEPARLPRVVRGEELGAHRDLM